MIIVKIIVLFGCISVFSALQTNYCKICANHTLCQYKIPGPSAACHLYDNTALLTNKEIQDLVFKINERRNFIAMGSSTILPQAANMKKIQWSPELARFAQRWADQCDPLTHPDREDDCRDLENTKVGQNIGSVGGSSPGLNVKSFIEIWFMQILNYVGTVTYYNQSRDYNTNYFTQLIWAETEFVGCGKVKFYVHKRKMTMVRLVCNFAPKGNIDGKPIYAIGYAGTQCTNNNNMIADKAFEGLCTYSETFQNPTEKYPVSSLLKILNLANDSVKQEIDPVNNNYKERNYKRNRQRNQKTRHVAANNGQGTVRRNLNMRNNFVQNMTKNMKDDDWLYQAEQGHSRLYHGQEEPLPVPLHTTHYFQSNNNQYILKHEYMSKPVYLISSPNYRKFNQHPQCTRHKEQSQFCCNNQQCTRGQHHCCQRSAECQSETFTNPIMPNTLCPQTTRCVTTCPTACPPLYTTVDMCKTDCICSRDALQSCKHIPNMLRSGNLNQKEGSSTVIQRPEQYYDSSEIHEIKHEKMATTRLNENLNKNMVPIKYNEEDRDYFYHSMDSSLRQKRQLESGVSGKPFWKLNNMNYENAFELKSLSYTTLTDRKNFKPRTNIQPMKLITTESITIKREDYSMDENDEENEEEKITEKYLSFDELMYLRKLSDNYMDLYPRRQGGRRKEKSSKKSKEKTKDKKKDSNKKATKAATTKAGTKKAATKKATTKSPSKAPLKATVKPEEVPTTAATTTTVNVPTTTTTTTTSTKPTTVYTANTPFERKKQCTRKLTCTWTIFTGTADDGKQIGPIEIGSRTPPGYVEGCTRTSTCTRDFMERNKMATTVVDTEVNEANEGPNGANDDEYCEKRSLKVHRRNSEQKDANLVAHNHKDFLNSHTNNSDSYVKSYGYVSDKKLRAKREEIVSTKDNSQFISYADLYYLVLNKMMKTNEAESRNTNTCLCNSSTNYRNVLFCLFCYVFLLIVIKY